MKTLIVCLRVYDPKTGQTRIQPHTLRYSSRAEFKAEMAKFRAKFARWNGEKPNG